ncbi:hypothetical protein Tco_0000230 [Tanacetum coccineum]
MASEPNDVKLQILIKLQEELDAEATLEEEMMNLFRRFCDRIRLYKAETIWLGSLPNNPLVDHGRESIERLTRADMRNASTMMLAKGGIALKHG